MTDLKGNFDNTKLSLHRIEEAHQIDFVVAKYLRREADI